MDLAILSAYNRSMTFSRCVHRMYLRNRSRRPARPNRPDSRRRCRTMRGSRTRSWRRGRPRPLPASSASAPDARALAARLPRRRRARTALGRGLEAIVAVRIQAHTRGRTSIVPDGGTRDARSDRALPRHGRRRLPSPHRGRRHRRPPRLRARSTYRPTGGGPRRITRRLRPTRARLGSSRSTTERAREPGPPSTVRAGRARTGSSTRRPDLDHLVLGVVAPRVVLVAPQLAVAEDLARVADREPRRPRRLDDVRRARGERRVRAP